MTYNAENAQEYKSSGKFEGGLPEDTIVEGVITEVVDGQIKDFVANLAKWKQPDQPAIKVVTQTTFQGATLEGNQMFPYFETDGVTTFGKRSDLAKFKAKYGVMPKVGVKVKVMSNSKGYLTIKLE